MWGGLPPLSFLVVCFVWASVVWAGLEGVSRTEAAAGWPCAVCVGLVGCGVVWCRKHACRASASCLCGEWGVVGAPACVGVACCRGSGVVRPGCLACVLLPCVGGGVWVWVGWL